jgi:uncharacterized protein (TIGR02646 family)
MKKINKSDEPSQLSEYRDVKPEADWNGFRNNSKRYKALKQQLIQDQKGLCAYCENNLLADKQAQGTDDFRVEHFHPKNPHEPPPNHALDWKNLLGVCTGGNQRDVIDNRFTTPDHSCDVPKKNHNWVGIILNPLYDVPAFPRYFQYIEQGNDAGKIEVDLQLCPTDLQQKAQETIDKERASNNLVNFKTRPARLKQNLAGQEQRPNLILTWQVFF